ncbi:MAG TPA: AAA domain-containing protein [Candidatus Dormibacteraeota bacterium]
MTSLPNTPTHNHTTIENQAVEPQFENSLGRLLIQVDLGALPWLAALAEGAGEGDGQKDEPTTLSFLSEFFSGVPFGLLLGPAYELTLVFTPQPGKFQVFNCHVDTPPDDMQLTKAALRVESMKPIEMSQTEWLLLPKLEVESVRFAGTSQEWSAEVAEWYRRFAVPGTPGAGIGDGDDTGTFTPINVSSDARTFLEQVDTVLDVLQTAREKRAQDLRRKATVVNTRLECPYCHHDIQPPARACENCSKTLGPAYQHAGSATEVILELGPGQADRFNSFQKLDVITPLGDTEAPFDVVDRNKLRLYFKRPVALPQHVEVAPIEGGAVAAAQRYAIDLALSGHPDLATVVQMVAAPQTIPEPGPEPLPRPLFNEKINDNEEQTEAVRRVVAMPTGSLMMLQGPPGTGKTTVIVEAVRQILEANQHARILISSHSNRAVDDATERLQKQGIKIFRLKAGEDKGPTTWDRAADERIVAATCNKAVVTEGQRGEKYTYAFLDEANKARAEETLPFIALGQRVVLIGDHHQLPPVVEEEDLSGLKRGTAEWHLARKSYFEILWESDLPAVSKIRLEVQHRMHPAVRHLVSQRFYGGSLRDGDAVKQYQRIKLFGQHRALVWIDSAGADVREVRTGNGSIYNVNHVNICRAIVRMLSERADPELSIALIGMYREQVRRYGNPRQWTNRDFRADTVDAFEGAEADIVIVDLVRSNPRGMVGFLEVHNRVNVAMSRAKRLLIVVGDSQTVRSNRVLRQVFEGFQRSGAIIPWHRLPGVGRSKTRRRRGRAGGRPEQGQRQPRVLQGEATTLVEAGGDQTPRRLPRLRPWSPGESPPVNTNGDGPTGRIEGAAPPTDPDGQARRRRHRRRRRRPRVPGGEARPQAGTEGSTPPPVPVPRAEPREAAE